MSSKLDWLVGESETKEFKEELELTVRCIVLVADSLGVQMCQIEGLQQKDLEDQDVLIHDCKKPIIIHNHCRKNDPACPQNTKFCTMLQAIAKQPRTTMGTVH